MATEPGTTVFSWKWKDCCGKGQTDDLYLNLQVDKQVELAEN